jgi:hypothetical protein
MDADISVRRVVLAIDTAERTLRVVREAVDVAVHLGVDLEGLFVEDDALLRMASHSFVRSFGAPGSASELSPLDLEREWRVLAEEVRRALEREARRRRVRSVFAISRGEAQAAIRERLSQGDLVLVGWGGFAPGSRRHPVRVMYDGSEASDRALGIGARLVGQDGELLVWVAPDGDRATELAAHIRGRIGSRVRRVRLAGMRDAAPATLRRAIAEEPGGLLIVPDEHELAFHLAQRSVAARFPCTVLIAH